MAEHTRPSDVTRAEESRESSKAHDAGREPTPEEEAAAESNSVNPDAREANKEMNERGARQR